MVASGRSLRREYPRLDVRGVAGSYEQALPWLKSLAPVTLAFLGSTIGNFDDARARRVPRAWPRARARRPPAPSASISSRTSLTLEAAYDDAAGVTALFTRNLFARMNRGARHRDRPRRGGARGALERPPRAHRHLRALRRRRIDLPSLGEHFRVARGETIRTEISRKFRADEMMLRVSRHGFVPVETFTDDGGRFASLLLRRTDDGARARRSPCAENAGHALEAGRVRIDGAGRTARRGGAGATAQPAHEPDRLGPAHVAELRGAMDGARARCRAADAPTRARSATGSTTRSATPPHALRELPLLTHDESFAYLDRVRAHAVVPRGARARDHRPRCCATVTSGRCWRSTRRSTRTISRRSRSPSCRYESHPARRRERAPARRPAARARTTMVVVPGGDYTIGTDDRRSAYDNERPAHECARRTLPHRRGAGHLRAFRAFLDDGGYRRRELWSDDGWSWLRESGGGHWRAGCAPATAGPSARSAASCRSTRCVPVIHVCWYEADAYARWAAEAVADRARVGRSRRRSIPSAASRGAIRMGRRAGDASSTRTSTSGRSCRCRSARFADAASSAASR